MPAAWRAFSFLWGPRQVERFQAALRACCTLGGYTPVRGFLFTQTLPLQHEACRQHRSGAGSRPLERGPLLLHPPGKRALAGPHTASPGWQREGHRPDPRVVPRGHVTSIRATLRRWCFVAPWREPARTRLRRPNGICLELAVKSAALSPSFRCGHAPSGTWKPRSCCTSGTGGPSPSPTPWGGCLWGLPGRGVT